MKHQSTLKFPTRASGILLHPTSLPGKYGIGDLGPAAYEFVDFLKEAGQTWWQTCPLGPISYGNSPYAALSAFAGNPLLISFEQLIKIKILTHADLAPLPKFDPHRVNYGLVQTHKMKVLKNAFINFKKITSPLHKQFKQFKTHNKFWLEKYAQYSAIKEIVGGAAWWDWEAGLRKPNSKETKNLLKKISDLVLFHKFVQFLFDLQWKELTVYARNKGVGLIGDIPIFMAKDSADVWANPTFFQIGPGGESLHVAGVPPDYFSKTGQRWGNPLYKWDALKRTGYRWWMQRLGKAFEDFDVLRLDHFIGFVRYWSIPGKDETAENGQWKKGPGADFFKKLFKLNPKAKIIAEDLGMLTPEVEKLRDDFKFPGMKILQFSFETHPGAEVNRPYQIKSNTVVYTGTHDNNTTAGWFENIKDEPKHHDRLTEADLALLYLGSDGSEIHWDMIRQAMQTAADTAIIPLQDVLGLGSNARLNTPGTMNGNWEWRLLPHHLTKEMSERLNFLTKIYDRQPY